MLRRSQLGFLTALVLPILMVFGLSTARAVETEPPADTTAPTITTATASPSVLWPPNHKMVPVTITVEATDDAGGTTTSKIVSVTSDEPENGTGDGNTSPDFEITGDGTVSLRAERSGNGDGRVYTISVETSDAAGNVATSEVTVTVPHDQGGGDDDDDDGCCIKPGDFRTGTQAIWGVTSNGNTYTTYLEANFEAVFPKGLVIGAAAGKVSGSSATFTNAAAILAFLPQGGDPAFLSHDHTDPLTTEAGILAGEVVALTLNIEFDRADKEYANSETSFGDLLIKEESSTFYGWTVQEVLDAANAYLGTGAGEVGALDFYNTLSRINSSFISTATSPAAAIRKRGGGDVTIIVVIIIIPGDGGSGGGDDDGDDDDQGDDDDDNGGCQACGGGCVQFLALPSCVLDDNEWGGCKKALKEKKGSLYDKLLKLFDRDGDGKLKGKEKRSFTKGQRDHSKKMKEKAKKAKQKGKGGKK